MTLATAVKVKSNFVNFAVNSFRAKMGAKPLFHNFEITQKVN